MINGIIGEIRTEELNANNSSILLTIDTELGIFSEKFIAKKKTADNLRKIWYKKPVKLEIDRDQRVTQITF
jgi:hypothetical protein